MKANIKTKYERLIFGSKDKENSKYLHFYVSTLVQIINRESLLLFMEDIKSYICL